MSVNTGKNQFPVKTRHSSPFSSKTCLRQAIYLLIINNCTNNKNKVTTIIEDLP